MRNASSPDTISRLVGVPFGTTSFYHVPSINMSIKTNVVAKGGKKYREKKTLVTQAAYPLPEAVALLTKVATTKFDGSAEVHIRIGADMTQSDQLVRGTVSLPHGTGKKVRVGNPNLIPNFVPNLKTEGTSQQSLGEAIEKQSSAPEEVTQSESDSGGTASVADARKSPAADTSDRRWFEIWKRK